MTTNSKAYATKAGQLIQKALEGDLTALKQLRAESAKEIVLNTSGYQNATEEVKTKLENLSTYISDFQPIMIQKLERLLMILNFQLLVNRW